MQRSRRKPVVARRSLPKEHSKLGGFFVLKVPVLGSSNPLLKPFIPAKKTVFGIKHGEEDEVEQEDLEEYSAEGEEMDGGAGIGFGDGIGSDEPDFGEADVETITIAKQPLGRYKHEREDQRGKRQKSLFDDSGEDESVIRCPCKNNVDYGLMIQCETCEVWQHSICVGIRHQTDVPTHYYCEVCHPRNFNCTCNKVEPIGKIVQCATCRTWQHVACVGTIRDPYSCPRCTTSTSRKPSSHDDGLSGVRPRSGGIVRRGVGTTRSNIIPGVKRGTRRSSPQPNDNDSPNTTDETSANVSTGTETQPNNKLPATPQESIAQLPSTPTIQPDTPLASPGNTYNFVNDDNLRRSLEVDHLLMQHCEEPASISDYTLQHRQALVKYSVEFCRAHASNARTQDDIIQGLSILLKEPVQSVLASMAKLAHELRSTTNKKSHITHDRKSWTEIPDNVHNTTAYNLAASWTERTEAGLDIESGRAFLKREVASGFLIAEYKGIVDDLSKVLKEYTITDEILVQAPSPFILFLSSIHIAVDARKCGSSARFVRRSCTPNSTVTFGEYKNQLRVGIFSTQKIEVDTEVTIPFDYPYQTLNNPIDCACGNNDSCSATHWFSHCADLGIQLQDVLSAYHTEITHAGHLSESEDEEENDQDEQGESGDGSKSFSKSLRDHKRRRSSGVKMLESTLNPYTPPSDKLTREQRKLQALMVSFEKMEKGKKVKKEDAPQERRWKRKRRDELSSIDSPNSPNISSTNTPQTNSSTREWRGRYTRKSHETTPSASPMTPTNPSSSPQPPSASSPSLKVSYAGKKAWLQELNNYGVSESLEK